MSIKDEYTFRFSIFLIIGLRNASADCWFEIILFSIADLSCVSKVSECARVTAPLELVTPEDFLSKTYKPLKQDFFDIQHISGFSNIKCFIT